MNDPLETHRSFVNSWECDENVHLNVQFYWKRFGEAAQIFAALSSTESRHWIDRHVRYHGELMMGANTIIHSVGGDEGNHIVHRLTNGETGKLSATAIDQLGCPIQLARVEAEKWPEDVAPVSLPIALLTPVDTTTVLHDGRGLVSHRSVLQANECDGEGQLLDQFHIARFSDAASHFWQHLGVSGDWMQTNNFGTVAVEMKASRHSMPRVGMIVEVVTWLEQLRGRTLTFRHQVSNLATGSPLYSGAVTALLMDLDKRKAVPLPSFIAMKPL